MVGESAIHRLPWKLLRFGTATSLSPQLPSPGNLSNSEDSCSIEIFVLSILVTLPDSTLTS